MHAPRKRRRPIRYGRTFVENDNLKGGIGIGCVVRAIITLFCRSDLSGRRRNGQRGKVFDFVPHYANAAFIRCVQFQDPAFPIGWWP
jgi:hypothetical protein